MSRNIVLSPNNAPVSGDVHVPWRLNDACGCIIQPVRQPDVQSSLLPNPPSPAEPTYFIDQMPGSDG